MDVNVDMNVDVNKKEGELTVGAFFKGLGAAVVGGVANSIVQSGNTTDTDHITKAAVSGALIGGFTYLVGHLHGQAAEKNKATVDGHGDASANANASNQDQGEQKSNAAGA